MTKSYTEITANILSSMAWDTNLRKFKYKLGVFLRLNFRNIAQLLILRIKCFSMIWPVPYRTEVITFSSLADNIELCRDLSYVKFRHQQVTGVYMSVKLV